MRGQGRAPEGGVGMVAETELAFMSSGCLTSLRSRRRAPLARVLALAVLLPPLGACTMRGDWCGTKEGWILDDPADKLYNEGLFLLNQKRDYKAAAKRFEEVDRQHPYSEWARKALVMSAYTYYPGGAYEESIPAARRYIQLHP